MAEQESHMTDEEYLLEQMRREQKRKKREKKREDDDEAGMNINSLMDIMVIILVFLLKSYGEEPLKVLSPDLKVPTSAALLQPEDTTTITISQTAIVVDDSQAVDVKDGAVDKSQKKGGESSLLISPLYEKLVEATTKRKREMELLKREYKPMATIIADQSTPYRLLTEVMYTAGQAELSQYKFAVIKTARKSLGNAAE